MSTFGDDLSAMAADDRVLAKFLDEMGRLGTGSAPEPSAQLAAVFAGTASITAVRRSPRRRLLLNAAAVAVLAMALLVVGAATHHLPAAAQRLISRVVNDVTPFHIEPDGRHVVPAPGPSGRTPAGPAPGRHQAPATRSPEPSSPGPSLPQPSLPRPSYTASAPPSGPEATPTSASAPKPSTSLWRSSSATASATAGQGSPPASTAPADALRRAGASQRSPGRSAATASDARKWRLARSRPQTSPGNPRGTAVDDPHGDRHRGVVLGRRGAGFGDGDRPVPSSPAPSADQYTNRSR